MSNAVLRVGLAESNRLPILATSINDHVAAADAATRRGLEHAIAAGLLLLEAKELVPRGEWLGSHGWLEANCRVGVRQAQTYMRLARNRHKLEALTKTRSDSYLTIAAAEALVGRPKPERPRGLPGQLDMLGGEEVIAGPAAPILRSRREELTSVKEMRALIGHVVARLWKWSDADERQRHKIIQILEHAGRLIEQIAPR